MIITFVFALYFALGCFFEPLTMMVFTLPLVSPVIAGLGFDPIWFGVVLVICCEAGLITPPIGMNLFVLKGIYPKYPLTVVIQGAAPFLVPMVAALAILTAFPQLALWLPELIY